MISQRSIAIRLFLAVVLVAITAGLNPDPNKVIFICTVNKNGTPFLMMGIRRRRTEVDLPMSNEALNLKYGYKLMWTGINPNKTQVTWNCTNNETGEKIIATDP